MGIAFVFSLFFFSKFLTFTTKLILHNQIKHLSKSISVFNPKCFVSAPLGEIQFDSRLFSALVGSCKIAATWL